MLGTADHQYGIGTRARRDRAVARVTLRIAGSAAIATARTAPAAALALAATAVALALAVPAAAQQQAVFPLDTLTIQVGGRSLDAAPAATRSVEVIGRAEIDRLGTTVAEVLARALNVDVLPRSAAQADLAIRGASFEQVLVLVDGVRVSDEQTGHFDLDLSVPLDMIERIEILRGPGSTLYGPDAIGGVVNIVTRTRPTTRFSAGGGGFETYGAGFVGSTGGDAFGVEAGGDYRRSDGHRTGTDYELAQGRVAIDAPAGAGRVRASSGFAMRDFGAADFYAPYESYEETRALNLGVRWQPAAGAGLRVEPVLAFRHHADDFILIRDDPGFYRNLHDSYQANAEVVVRHAAARRLAVAWGAEANGAWLESSALGARRELRAATFGEAAIGDAGGALLTAGLRVDWHTAWQPFVSPSLAGALTVRDGVRLRASGSRGFRAPSYTERYYVDPGNIGDPSLRPERFWAGEVGVMARLAAGVRLDAAAFVRDASQLIDWAKPAGAGDETPFRTMNVEDATFTGVEAKLDGEMAGVDWAVRAAILDFDDDAAQGFTGRYALSPIMRSAGITASAPIGALRVTFDVSTAERHGQDGYVRADARAGYTYRGAELFAEVTNITDADYLDASAKAVAGRALFIGARWTGGR